MEAVGARVGRSSSRFGSSAVFSGPVRKWKKKWVHMPSSNSANHLSQPNQFICNGGPHLLLYKWTPTAQSSENGNDDNNGDKNAVWVDGAPAAPGEPHRKKPRYVPIVALEEQKKKVAEMVDYEAKWTDTGPSGAGPTFCGNGFNGKPDINNVPMEETQTLNGKECAEQVLNNGMHLSLDLKAQDDNCDLDSEHQNKEAHFESCFSPNRDQRHPSTQMSSSEIGG